MLSLLWQGLNLTRRLLLESYLCYDFIAMDIWWSEKCTIRPFCSWQVISPISGYLVVCVSWRNEWYSLLLLVIIILVNLSIIDFMIMLIIITSIVIFAIIVIDYSNYHLYYDSDYTNKIFHCCTNYTS